MGSAGRRVGVRNQESTQRVLGWEVAGPAAGEGEGLGRTGSTVSCGLGHRDPTGGEDGESRCHRDSCHGSVKEETGDVSRIRPQQRAGDTTEGPLLEELLDGS